jgi:hypothetical protein
VVSEFPNSLDRVLAVGTDAKKVGDAAFDDPSKLDKPIKDLQNQLKRYTTTTVTVQ